MTEGVDRSIEYGGIVSEVFFIKIDYLSRVREGNKSHSDEFLTITVYILIAEKIVCQSLSCILCRIKSLSRIVVTSVGFAAKIILHTS